jgi:hypothetical protein
LRQGLSEIKNVRERYLYPVAPSLTGEMSRADAVAERISQRDWLLQGSDEWLPHVQSGISLTGADQSYELSLLMEIFDEGLDEG